ncbi:MAG: hypothetical protein KatS3mg038_2730 [Candidatus Kapaibacterium sp.]|nr:MAG: hypothetical protein KatS3mg038_2108 [Candidatus Kapabacteria bacterium]GIV52209.1 MAG: hypothetical protein KatS3mg038_2730 [Candidatus Kapabacteria bacterium]
MVGNKKGVVVGTTPRRSIGKWSASIMTVRKVMSIPARLSSSLRHSSSAVPGWWLWPDGLNGVLVWSKNGKYA